MEALDAMLLEKCGQPENPCSPYSFLTNPACINAMLPVQGISRPSGLGAAAVAAVAEAFSELDTQCSTLTDKARPNQAVHGNGFHADECYCIV